jgi:hypothetical protein
MGRVGNDVRQDLPGCSKVVSQFTNLVISPPDVYMQTAVKSRPMHMILGSSCYRLLASDAAPAAPSFEPSSDDDRQL